MEIREITQNKKDYLELLLLADEQESMVDLYLETGKMYVLDDGKIRGECVVTYEGDDVLEIRNLATDPARRHMGYGRALIDFVVNQAKGKYRTLQVGTSPMNVPFYEKCGFHPSHIRANFFTDNYDHPIYEDGVLLTDMIVLQKPL